jgi:hypothetical protein
LFGHALKAGEADTCGAQLGESLSGLLIFHNQPVVTGARVHANGPRA